MGTLFPLLNKIKTRPGLYIGTPSITALRMFIIGYRFARKEAGLTTTEHEHDFYKNFQPWLQTRLSIHTVNGWDKLLLLTCAHEQAAFEYFFQLLEEFQQRDKSLDLDPILTKSASKTSPKVA